MGLPRFYCATLLVAGAHASISTLVPPVLIEGQKTPRETLASHMQALHVPGVSIAVIHNGKLDWARGFGVIRAGGPAVTADTLFQACSISKPVSAMAVLHLVQQGKLQLDANVNGYLRSWKLPENELTSHTPVTLRELLNHTAGVTIAGFPGYSSGSSLPTLVQILDGEPPANTRPIRVDMLPGIGFRYSGGGYVVAQRVVEDVTGRPFAAVVHDTVLIPAHMTASTYEQPLRRSQNVAAPHDEKGEPMAGGAVIYPETAPAALWSTPTDLAHWALELQRAESGKSNVLSRSMAREMVTPGMDSFGLGLAIGGHPGHRYFTHSGVNAGFRTFLLAYEQGDGIVVMTNGANGAVLTNEILRTVAEEYQWPDFRPAVHRTSGAGDQDISGSYQLYRYTLMTITRDGNQLFVQRTGQQRLEILPEGPNRYFLKDVDAQLVFDFDAAGKVAGFTILQNGNTERASKVSETTAAAVDESRVHKKASDPLSEAVLHRYIEELRSGAIQYGRLSVEVAQMTRQREAEFTALIRNLGAVKAVSFKGVAFDGADVFDVEFENGPMQWQILPTAAGGVDQIRFTFLVKSVG